MERVGVEGRRIRGRGGGCEREGGGEGKREGCERGGRGSGHRGWKGGVRSLVRVRSEVSRSECKPHTTMQAVA